VYEVQSLVAAAKYVSISESLGLQAAFHFDIVQIKLNNSRYAHFSHQSIFIPAYLSSVLLLKKPITYPP